MSKCFSCFLITFQDFTLLVITISKPFFDRVVSWISKIGKTMIRMFSLHTRHRVSHTLNQVRRSVRVQRRRCKWVCHLRGRRFFQRKQHMREDTTIKFVSFFRVSDRDQFFLALVKAVPLRCRICAGIQNTSRIVQNMAATQVFVD